MNNITTISNILYENYFLDLAVIFTIIIIITNTYLIFYILKKQFFIDDVEFTGRNHFYWFYKVFKLFIGLNILYLLIVIFLFTTKSSLQTYFYYLLYAGIILTISCLIKYTNVCALLRFMNLKNGNQDNTSSLLAQGNDLVNESIFKPKKKTLFDLENVHYQNFMVLLEKDKIYLDPLLSLESVANNLEISPGYLSCLLNDVSQKNFSEIIGQFRTEEVKRMLDNPEFDSYSILTIGYEAGFNSKSSIYKTFKKNTGMTPSEYREKS